MLDNEEIFSQDEKDLFQRASFPVSGNNHIVILVAEKRNFHPADFYNRALRSLFYSCHH
jgi:hypothetical protein